MKKFLFILMSLIFVMGPSLSGSAQTFVDEETAPVEEYTPIYLNAERILTPQTEEEQKLYKQEKLDFDKNISEKDNRYYNNNDNAKSSVTHTFSKKINNSTYGTKLDSNMNADSSKQAVTLFKKYEKEKFSVDTAYKNSNPSAFGQETSGTVSVAPAFKLNDSLSIKNVFSSDLQKDQKKGEVILSVQPLKTDRMKLDLGAGQVVDTNNDITRSQLNFSTKFRF